MHILVYDGSFAGFFSAVFESYRLRLNVRDICIEAHYQADMFCERMDIETSEEYAKRIQRGIRQRAGDDILETLYRAFLSEEEGVEMKLYAYLKRLFGPECDFAAHNPLSAELSPILLIAQSVIREWDLYLGMVRFQKVDDSLYVARILPKYNVVTLLAPHFKRRLPDQQWLIFDEKRKYGVYYDKVDVAEVEIENFKLPADTDEFCRGWEAYYRSVNIKERQNPICMRTHLPGRYWDALPERAQKLRTG